MQISLATRRASTFGGRGGFRGRGGGRGRGKQLRTTTNFYSIVIFLGGGDYGGYRGNDHRSGGRGASHGSSRDHRSNPY